METSSNTLREVTQPKKPLQFNKKGLQIFVTIDPEDGGNHVKRKNKTRLRKELTYKHKIKQEDSTEKKTPKPRATRDGHKRKGYMGNKPYKSKIMEIKGDVFKVGSSKNAAQFTKSLLNVADYIQIKYNN